MRFRNVFYRYPSARRLVSNGFELEVAPGQVAALLGVNGAGKSTLFKLLCRLYDSLYGAVEIEGCDLRRIRLADARRLTTAMRADVIHVLEDGRIVESGSHDELLVRGGRYAAAWHAQLDPID